MPVTCVRWKPTFEAEKITRSDVLASSRSNGLIQHLNLNTNKADASSEIATHRNNKCNINIMDYTCDGQKLLAAGKDRHVHVYDD